MNTSALIAFNYNTVDADTAAMLRLRAERIKTRIKKTTEDIIQIGKDLLAVKQQRLDHGQFRAWVETEVGINPRSAQMYMAAARLFEKNEIISRLLPTTVYRLASPSTPPEIVEAVTTKAASGEVVPDIMVKKMIEEAKYKIREEQANKRKAERRSRLSKKKRQELERREQVGREAEERRREELVQAVVALIGTIGIDGAKLLCAISETVSLYGLIEALKAKIENPSEERPAA
jgi:hypothetical protein